MFKATKAEVRVAWVALKVLAPDVANDPPQAPYYYQRPRGQAKYPSAGRGGGTTRPAK